MHTVRTHLNEKRAFMKEWDKKHHDKWKETQVGWWWRATLPQWILHGVLTNQCVKSSGST